MSNNRFHFLEDTIKNIIKNEQIQLDNFFVLLTPSLEDHKFIFNLAYKKDNKIIEINIPTQLGKERKIAKIEKLIEPLISIGIKEIQFKTIIDNTEGKIDLVFKILKSDPSKMYVYTKNENKISPVLLTNQKDIKIVKDIFRFIINSRKYCIRKIYIETYNINIKSSHANKIG